MPSYQSMTNRVSAIAPARTTSCGSNVNHNPELVYPPPGLVTTRHLPSDLERKWKYDPPVQNTQRRYSFLRRAGDIVMSNYSIGTEVSTHHVVSRNHVRKHIADYFQRNSSGDCCDPHYQWTGYSSWTENDHFGSLSDKGVPLLIGSESVSKPDIAFAVKATQASAFSKSLGTFDVLTELAEAKQVHKTAQQLVGEGARVLKKFERRNPREVLRYGKLTARKLLKSSDKAARVFGNKWLLLQYAIMPIAYSIEDVTELWGERVFVYKTSRSRERLGVERRFPSSDEETYMARAAEAQFDISSTVKLRYTKGILQRVGGQMNFNAIKTAWELLPYSFVVDWFWNVGETITNNTSIDISTQRKCCTSIRERSSVETRFMDTSSDVSERTHGGNACISPYTDRFEFPRNVNSLLDTFKRDTYTRFVWEQPPSSPHFDPYLDWKRYLSGAALSYQPTKKLLTKLSRKFS